MITSFSWLASTLIAAAQLTVSVENQDKPVANQKVQLVELSTQPELLEHKLTNSKGQAVFRFDGNEPKRLIATSEFEGVSYISEPILLEGDENKNLRLEVFSTTTSKAGLVVENLSTLLTRQDNQYMVSQNFSIRNDSGKTVVAGGTEQEPGEVFRFALPKAAFNVQYGYGFDRSQLRFDGSSVVYPLSIPPGRSFFSLIYALDRIRFYADINQSFSIPIESADLGLANAAWSVQGSKAQPIGQKILSDQEVQLYRLTPQGHRLNFRISGLDSNIPLSWWLPGLIFILLMVTSLLQKDPGLRKEKEEESADKAKLLKAWREIQLLKEKKLISASEFEKRQLSLLQELEAFYI